MSEEELKKLCKEEFLKNIKENIKSATIFTYVDGLEKENKKQKEVLDKIKEYINHAQNYGTMAQVMPHLKPYVNGDDILELLEEIDSK